MTNDVLETLIAKDVRVSEIGDRLVVKILSPATSPGFKREEAEGTRGTVVAASSDLFELKQSWRRILLSIAHIKAITWGT